MSPCTGPATWQMRPATTSKSELLPRHQPLEARVALEWREGGINPEPAGREVVGHLEQRFELVERLLGREVVGHLEQRFELVERLLELAHEQIDAHQLLPSVGAVVG